MSFSTNYINPDNFRAIVTVNLTAMLVIVTLFVNDMRRFVSNVFQKSNDRLFKINYETLLILI